MYKYTFFFEQNLVSVMDTFAPSVSDNLFLPNSQTETFRNFTKHVYPTKNISVQYSSFTS